MFRHVMFALWAAVVGPMPTVLGAEIVIGLDGKVHGTGLIHKAPELEGLGEQHVVLEDCGEVPADFDLRDLGLVSETRDQGSCGSCWAFSRAGAVESAQRAAGGSALNLAEQELVSCDRDNSGCNGGNLNGFRYETQHGQGVEEAFPYTARTGRCKEIAPALKVMDHVLLGTSKRRATPKELQCALMKYRSTPWITVSAGGGNWNNPPTSDDGVFTRCGSGGTNHAVGVTGWTTKGTTVYFHMRNSWGNWGSSGGRPGMGKGYAMMTLGCDSLGEEIGFAIMKQEPHDPPHVRLPATVSVYKGDEVMIGVREESGVSYTWFTGTTQVGTGSMLYVSPVVDTVYRLVGTNSAGSTESSVKVVVIVPPTR